MNELKVQIDEIREHVENYKVEDGEFSCSKCGTLLVVGNILDKSSVSCPKCGKANTVYKFKNMREEVNKLRVDTDHWLIAYFLNVSEPSLRSWIAKNQWEKFHAISCAINEIKAKERDEYANADIKKFIFNNFPYSDIHSCFGLTIKNMNLILDWNLSDKARAFIMNRLEEIVTGTVKRGRHNRDAGCSCYFLKNDLYRIPIYDFAAEVELPLEQRVHRLTRTYVIPD